MFKNTTPFRFTGPALQASLDLMPFVPCGPTQERSIGFLPHEKHLTVVIERKQVPAEALTRRVDAIAANYEQQSGCKPGKKMRKEMKEHALLELLPHAFAKRKRIPVMFLAQRGLLLVGSTSSAEVDEIVSLLVKSQDELAVSMLLTKFNPAVEMGQWLQNEDQAPGAFSIGRACILTGTGKVRYDQHSLLCSNVREHLTQGKTVESMALSYGEHVEFTLTEALQLKGVKLIGLSFEVDEHGEAEDAERFLWGEHLSKLLDDLIAEMGGLV